ncbi:ER membrane glycoprotein subunit of the GPI transamidase complex-like protein [Pestalotiopsis sp. 9143b]|nr:ER membrane glycoprotein subunit of the GPI transamidase complex-like protein [Pestalotiopsis sp. 9143b]
MASVDMGRPLQTLITVFVAWKSFLLLVAIGSSVGGAYDTSTTLIQPQVSSFNESVLDISTKLTRWDAIYFIQAARRGYVYEQEWAFGMGLPTVISAIAKVSNKLGIEGNDSLEPLIGVGVSHVAHLLSVFALYYLGLRLYSQRTAVIAALLHIISPAGLFLSAPYNEAPFAFLTFSGLLLFSYGCLDKSRSVPGDAAIVASGMILGLATTFRSNGILNGVPFAAYAISELVSVLKSPNAFSLRRLAALGIGGQYIAMGSIGPQVLAYQSFCSGPSATEPRPWCSAWIPSIYTFVQERYWNVGFLRYWVPGNIPLFLLASPMIYLLCKSGWSMLGDSVMEMKSPKTPADAFSGPSLLIAAMAFSQLLLAGASVTTYHIQIITRLSSACPLWYFWLAQQLGQAGTSKSAGGVVMYMVIYATIQGALFASFLPPA